MAPKRYPSELREQARVLRREGLSTAQVAERLGVRSHSVVGRWVDGIDPPSWTRRPNAKDALRDVARRLRAEGASLKVIARTLQVSTSTASLWVRDLPVPEGLRERSRHARRMNLDRWVLENERRDGARRAVKALAHSFVGPVSHRELVLLGAVLYWAEGSKDKAYARRESVAFVNSDVRVVGLFLRWLDVMGVPEADRRYRISIHESADIADAQRFWTESLNLTPGSFQRTTIKRHRPRTNRRNVGEDYHGCLVVRVYRSRVLYQQIEGLFAGLSDATIVGGGRSAPRPPEGPAV